MRRKITMDDKERADRVKKNLEQIQQLIKELKASKPDLSPEDREDMRKFEDSLPDNYVEELGLDWDSIWRQAQDWADRYWDDNYGDDDDPADWWKRGEDDA